MSYDQVLDHLGEFGKYQKKIFFLLCLPAISCGFHKLASVFIQARPDFRCRLPDEGVNATFAEIPASNYSLYYPWDDQMSRFSQCLRYANVSLEGGGIDDDDGGGGRAAVRCDQWIYDPSQYYDSVLTEFNLVCDKGYLRSTADSIFMFGVLLGSIIFGIFSDKSGTGGPQKTDARWGSSSVFFSMGYILLALLAYLIRNWRYLQGAISFSATFFLGYWWFIPESNRWLISQGRIEEARENILFVAKENEKTIPPDLLEKALEKPEDHQSQQRGPSSKSFFSVCKYSNLRNKLMNIFYCWFANSVAYYGLSWNTSNLGGNDYLNFFISGIVEIPGYALILLTINRWGRKPTFCGTMLFGGLVLICTSFVPADQQWVIVTLAMMGKLAVTASYGTIYIFSAEQFPTVIRSLCMGVASMFARVGGILSPHITMLSDFWTPLPLIVLGGLVLLGGFLGLLLPETLNRRLPDTIEQGDMFGKIIKGKITYLEDVPLRKEKRIAADGELGHISDDE